MRTKSILLLCMAIGCLRVHGQFQDSTSAALSDLVTDFQAAIEAKDSLRFKALFFHDNVPFIGIMSKPTEWSIKKDNPRFEGIAVSNCSRFIREVCTSDKSQSETVHNVRIDTDGLIATVRFDYGFAAGGVLTQWGHEAWTVVMVDGAWAITDVVYSIRYPAIEPFPYAGSVGK
ncbi:MAG: hypothetical protein KA230_05060 [Flavobacteriales bacterium]|nr:hypothetical protein [Flavobacteriales bacterium]